MIVLHQVNIINDGVRNIGIEGSKICAISSGPVTSGKDALHLHFGEDCIALPGLINSHEHLDFNLFPQLGNYHYNNYTEWGKDIHKQNKETIGSVLKVPKHLRTEWGLYKNALNGVTTVVQHGENLNSSNNPIDVFNACHSLHSVALERRWKYRLNKPFNKNIPYVIHIGEGTDEKAYDEIDRLIRWNLFKRKIIGVHGVAMNEKQAQHFKALIWCPESNMFLLGKTADIKKLKQHTTILFGTDSTVSADWSIWEHLRLAREMKQLDDIELINAVSLTAAKAWGLEEHGAIKEKNYADVVIAKRKSKDDTEAFFAIHPADLLLVISKGQIILFDASINTIPSSSFSKIYIHETAKYIKGNLTDLVSKIKNYYPDYKFPFTTD